MSKEPMRCPNDGARLVELERADVLIDACPTCRGVWLDRGELDKILVAERQMAAGGDDDFMAEVSGRRAQPKPQQQQPRYDDRDDRHRDRDHRDDYYKKKKKKRSLLEDLLDF